MKKPKRPTASNQRPLGRAASRALEQLEPRQMMADVVQSLPFSLGFDRSVPGTLLDKQGRGIGLTSVQANARGDQYQPGLLELDTTAGALKLTTRGSSAAGSSSGVDNSLGNALETSFNGNQRGFTIEARLLGPLGNLNDRFEQAGIYFGPDQDNFVKLVVGRNFNGQFLSFEDEFTNATGGVSSTRNNGNAQTDVGSFAAINTLDVRLVGDAATGKISAYYRTNSDGNAYTKVGYDITIAQEKRSAFFNAASRAGLMAQHRNDLGPITASFDSFSIKAGIPLLGRPSVSGVEGMSGSKLDVRRDATLRALLTLANDNSGVNGTTLTSANVRLYRASDAAAITTTLGTASGGSTIVVQPAALLDANTTYTLEVNNGLQDAAGAAFQPFVTSFTTGTSGASVVSDGGPVAIYGVDALYFSDISNTASNGWGASAAQTLRITNAGTAALSISSLTFGGANANDFQLAAWVALPASIKPGASLDVPIVFNASAVGLRAATLTIGTNDAAHPTKVLTLRGLGTAGEGGSLEPSLQRILDLYQIPVNVGDPTPDTFDIPSPSAGGDAVDIERLRKAGTGPVTIEVLANFANSVSPSSRFGYYSAGQLVDRTQLFTVGQSSAQTVRPVTTGALSFNPAGDFGLYGEFPAFAGRVVASEKSFNTWETNSSRQQKVRFFPLKNADGTTVANAYVFTFEEYTVEFDQNDIVGIIRNVQPAAAGAEIGIVNLDGVPASDRLIFSRIRDIQAANDPYILNTFHDRSTLRITNSGNANLVVSGVSISNGDFVIESGGGAFTLSPGATRDVVVKFVYDQGGYGNAVRTATLTIQSNDADEGAKTLTLAGLWQSNSENSPDGVSREPTAQLVLQTLGYNVNLGTLNTQGAVSRVGEEVLSEYWNAADTSKAVGVRMLAAYHQNKNNTNSHIRWYPQGEGGNGYFLFQHRASDGQTLLPLKNFSTDPAAGEFTPYGPFAWAIDSDWSIDARNTNAYNPAAFPIYDGGHAMRFFAVKDANGAIVPNAYLLIMDYVGQSFSNYDYQDNMFLLTDVKPASGPATPGGLSAYSGAGGNALAWAGNTEGNLAGYNVYRSTSAGGPFVKLNAAPLTNTVYTDGSAIVGTAYHYQVKGVDVHGTESATPATANATRSIDNVPPASPAYAVGGGASSGITLSWLDNAEPDLAGYNVYRAGSVDGPYVKLNGSPLGTSGYVDLSATAAATSYYRVTAIDATGNESANAPVTAYRPASGAVPIAPSALVVNGSTVSSITLRWTDNASNETGFVVERQNANGTFSQIGTTGANVTSYQDAGLSGGTSYVYRVRALNSAGPSAYSNELTATTPQSLPAAPTNLVVSALSANAVRLTWTDNATNESAYSIERRTGNGAFSTLDTVGTNVSLYVDASATAGTAYGYRVVATNGVGASPASNTATLTTPVADGYTSADIGNPLAAGSTGVVTAGRDFNITAGGTDVWDTTDQFRFVYKVVTGDFDYSARIADVSQADVGSMAGLMARESLDANARHLFMRARSTGLRANYRDATGGASTGVGNIPFAFPDAYVRLQRVGSQFTAYGSTDGSTWTVVHQMTMGLPSTLYFGIAVSARTPTAATTTAQVRDLTDRKAVVAPGRPDGLVGAADTTPRVALYWNDNATNESGYRVERRPNGSAAWATVGTPAANATSFIDTSVSLNQSYVYRVFAVGGAGESLPTNELTMTVSNGVPTAPSALVTSNAANGVKLVWNDSSSNESGFQIERRLQGSGSWTQLGVVTANATTYTDMTPASGQTYVYRLRALGSAGDSNYSGESNIDTPIAYAYGSVDIGGATSGATQTVGVGTDYNITSAGNDIWNNADQFRLVYRQVVGDFDVRVRVANLGYVIDQTMAGLMARASLDANGRHVFIKTRADGTARLTYRSSTGGTTAGVGSGYVGFPNAYLRLVRTGNTFAGYTSWDGQSWTLISQTTLSLPTTMYVGMAVNSHVTGTPTTAQFRDLTLTTPA